METHHGLPGVDTPRNVASPAPSPRKISFEDEVIPEESPSKRATQEAPSEESMLEQEKPHRPPSPEFPVEGQQTVSFAYRMEGTFLFICLFINSLVM